MHFEWVEPTRRDDSRPDAAVSGDGTVRLGSEELRRLGAGDGAPLRVARVPVGVSLVPRDMPPQKIYVELTAECNLDCAMCIRHASDEPVGRMTAATFDAILGQIRGLPTLPSLNFSGFGEPMAHPLFSQFLARARQAGCAVEIVTNGTLLTREAAERLIELGLDRVVVSVDGITPSASQRLHASSFPQIAASLKMLSHLKAARRVAHPEIGLEFVATKRNIAELPEIKRLAPLLGFTHILVTNLVPHTLELAGETLYERWTTAAPSHGASHWDPSVDLPPMDPASEATAPIERLRLAGTALRLNGAEIAGARPRCRFVTEGRLAIAWDGSVSPCLPLLRSCTYYFRGHAKRIRRYSVGNVNQTPLRQLWDLAEYRAFRERVRRFEFAPCLSCGGCELRDSNEEDCVSSEFPRCGECLWAAGLCQCP